MIEELCICKALEKEAVTKIQVYTTKKKFKKLVTVIEGINKTHIAETAKVLKQRLACGGTAKEGVIVLQGDHKKKIPELLTKLGYNQESIEVR